MRIIRNKLLFGLVVLMRATPWFGFVTHAGRPVAMAEAAGAPARAGVGALVAALLVCVWLPQQWATWGLQLAVALTMLPLLLFAAGQAAAHLAGAGPGAGFYWIVLLAALVAANALHHLRVSWVTCVGTAGMVAAACAALVRSGALAALAWH
jgi:hypothetical protein